MTRSREESQTNNTRMQPCSLQPDSEKGDRNIWTSDKIKGQKVTSNVWKKEGTETEMKGEENLYHE